MMDFAKTLKKAREDNGLTQEQLASKLFVNRSSIANWEAGRRMPSYDLLVEISKVLKINLPKLINISEKKEESPIIIVVDDESIILNGEMSVITE